jgi:signal transduction histidine kinase/DNA-binding response OmpR family regulator
VGYPYNQGRFGANLTSSTPSYVYPHRMWFGTQGNGLMLFDKVKGVYMSTPELNKQGRLLGVHVNAILEDKAGILWVGTYNSGVISYDLYTRQIHFYRQGRDSNLGSNQITKIFQDSDGQIWVGTAGGGLSLYNSDTDSFGTFTTKDGLPSNTIKGILEDTKKNLWFSTNEGLGQLNTQTMTFKTFGEADGLQGKEFLINAYAQNARGEMFFGGTSGLNVFHPDSLQESKQVPAIYITGLRLFNKRVEAGEKDSPLKTSILATKVLTLNASQSVLSLDYLALDYQQSKDNQYAYILEGFDPEWNYVAKQRTATYTNLNDGTYTFKVKATNNDGVWNEQPTELTIIILPPWYRTWWAFGIYGVLILLSLLALRRAIAIRERLKADVLLQEREKEQIQELDRLKTNFFTNISHEFRTPLTLIISPLERFFSDNSDKDLPDKQAKQLRTIHQNAKKLLSLINQLLDLSKLEAGKLTPEISQNDLIEFLEKLTYSFNGLAEQKQISLSLNSPIDRALVYFDLDIIEKVVTNLLSNAFKHTPAHGSITVELTLDRNRTADISRVKIAVKDTGVGIPPAHLSNIFSRFYQISETSYNQNVGSGVGLALCKELIELHRGDITVISKVGEGTTFAINIPVFKGAFDFRWIKETAVDYEASFPEQASSRAVSVSQVNGSEEKAVILVAEDNDDLRAYIHDIFVGKFDIIEADNGEDALEKALTHIPDLIISDWMMPKMTGVELCSKVKLNEKTSHIPIIILTSKSSNDSKMEGLETGADDYITKPFNANLLEVRVTNLLASRRRLRERFQQATEVSPKEITLNTADEHFLEKSIRIVEENMANPDFDIQALELALKMSNMQLYRKLKGVTGLSGIEFIRTIRLKKAFQLLETATYSVAEVAYQVGFNDPSYFTRIFKKEYGKAPSEIKG